MGCCSFKHEEIMGGLILPHLQRQIQSIEALHPFAQIPSSILYSELSKFRKTKQISKHLFEIIMKRLKISPKPFQNPKSPLFYFSRGITNQYKYFDMNKILLSAVLLGKAEFEQKLKFLLKIYREEKSVSRRVIKEMLEGLANVSINVLPRMIRIEKVQQEYTLYIERIKSRIPELIESILILMKIEADFWNFQELLFFFEEYSDLQKVLWPHGIRIMAIEEDLKNIRPKLKYPKLSGLEKFNDQKTGVSSSKIEECSISQETSRYTLKTPTIDQQKNLIHSEFMEERVCISPLSSSALGVQINE